MMMVPTEIRVSPIQGFGVFLLMPVRKGDLIWRFDTRIDRAYSNAELASLPELARDFVKTYSCWHQATGLWAWHGDNGRYINHSDQPNTYSLGRAFGDDIANVDIAAGVELTADYRTICDYTIETGNL